MKANLPLIFVFILGEIFLMIGFRIAGQMFPLFDMQGYPVKDLLVPFVMSITLAIIFLCAFIMKNKWIKKMDEGRE
jgi:hypothetical protein